jgi:hypothetical protein
MFVMKQNLTATVKASSAPVPEFVDLDGLRQIFGIKRAMAYQLIRAGVLDSLYCAAKAGRAENDSSAVTAFAAT